jgi:hypothetical protein
MTSILVFRVVLICIFHEARIVYKIVMHISIKIDSPDLVARY